MYLRLCKNKDDFISSQKVEWELLANSSIVACLGATMSCKGQFFCSLFI